MKMRTLSVLAGITAPLILTTGADAGFVGIKVVKKLDAQTAGGFPINVLNIYAEFDNQGNDSLDGVAGTPDTPLNITVIGGTFWNRQFGGETAPSSGLVAVFPSLAFDSFYTIGLKSTTPGIPDTTTLLNMPTLGAAPGGPFVTSVFTTNGSWTSLPPTAPQADPWDQTSGGTPGQVLIGNFSTMNGFGFVGNFLIQFIGDGQGGQAAVSFEWYFPTPGGLALLGVAGLISMRRRRRQVGRGVTAGSSWRRMQ
jgi:MYXO-CTERM domain-containing protein